MSSPVIGQQKIHTGEKGCNYGKSWNQNLHLQNPQRTEIQTEALAAGFKWDLTSSNNAIPNITRIPQSSAWIFYCLVGISSICLLSFTEDIKLLFFCGHLQKKLRGALNPSTPLPSLPRFSTSFKVKDKNINSYSMITEILFPQETRPETSWRKH